MRFENSRLENLEKFNQKKSEVSADELQERNRELNKNFETELDTEDGGYGEKMSDRKIEALDTISEQVREEDSAGTKEGVSAYYKFNPEKEMEKIKCGAALTTIDNVSRYFSQKIDIEEMARNIAGGTEKLKAEARVFITEAAVEKVRPSAYKMIDSLSDLGLPKEVISGAKECFESVMAFAEGKADLRELGYDLSDIVENVLIGQFGEIIAERCGGAMGHMLALAISAALKEALSGINPEDVQAVVAKMQGFAKSAIDTVAALSAQGAAAVKKSINTFLKENGVQM